MFNVTGWIKETNPEELKQYFEILLKDSGFGIEGKIEKHFKPFGYTLLILLSESHFAIHTFPEENTSYFELSSCIEKPFILFKKLHNDK